MLWRIITIVLAGLVFNLDRVQAFQLHLWRPVVCAPLVGFLLGNVLAGAAVGAVLELLWLASLPVGGVIPPNTTVAAVLAAGGACGVVSAGAAPLAAASFFILLCLPFGLAATRIDVLLRRANVWLSQRAESQAQNPAQALKAAELNFVGLPLAALVFAVFLFLSALLVVAGGEAFYRLHLAPYEEIMQRCYFVLAGAAGAALFLSFSGKRQRRLFWGAFFVSTILTAVLLSLSG